MAQVTIIIRDANEAPRPGENVLVEIRFDRPLTENRTPAQETALQLAGLIQDIDRQING